MREDDLFELAGYVALVGPLALALLGAVCLIRCKGPERRRLAWAAGVFLGALALHLGGGIVLGWFGLAWRNLPAALLFLTVLFSGWTANVLTLGCVLPWKWPNLAPVLRVAVKGAAVAFTGLVILSTLWIGLLAAVFGYVHEERIVEHEGQTLVEEDMSWLDPIYYYYEYRGPLLRGSELIYRESGQIDRMG